MTSPIDASSSSPAPYDRKAVFTLVFIAFIDLMGFGLVIPLLPYYATRFEASPLEVTLLTAVFSLCQFIASPFLGSWSDRFGRRPILMVCQLGSVVGYICLALSTLISWPAVWMGLAMIYLSRIIDGFTAGNITVAQAYISDIVPPKQRPGAMGLMGAAFGLGFAFGPGIGGVLGHYNPAYPAILAALCSLAASIMVIRFLPESHNDRSTSTISKFAFSPARLQLLKQTPALAWLSMIWFFCMFAYVMLEPTIPLLLQSQFGYGQREAGIFFFAVGMVIIVIQGGVIGRLSKHVSEFNMALAGSVLATLAMLGYAWVASQPAQAFTGTIVFSTALLGLGISALLNATGRSLQTPTLSSLLSHHVEPQTAGSAFGVYQGMASLARVIGPIVAGLMFARSPAQMFLLAAALTALAGLLLVLSRRALAHSSVSEESAQPALADQIQSEP